MTTSPRILTGRVASPAEHPAIEVRWSAVRAASSGPGRTMTEAPGAQRTDFVLTVRPLDDRHAMIECFIEGAAGPRTVMRRRPVSGTTTMDGSLLHVDAELDGRRLVALTFDTDPAAARGCRLMYVQCALLAEAGFTPGGFDPPTASLLPSDRAAAPAPEMGPRSPGTGLLAGSAHPRT